MDRKPTVWIINKGGHTYRKAEKFGALVPVTTDKINPFRPDRLALEIASKLKHGYVEDFLLLSGPPIANALAICLWLRKFPTVNVLQWSANGREYELRTIDSEILEELMQ